MKPSDIRTYRLQNQQLLGSTLQTAQEMVAWLGAVQAQDYAMAKMAIGLRLPNATDRIIENAMADASIIRTHVLRPTWHFVSCEDIYWMLELSAPQIRAASAIRDRELGMDAVLFTRSNDVIAKTLQGGKHLTREELMVALEQAGIATNPSRAVHFMMAAELEGIVANGIWRGKQLTYALLEENVPKKKSFTRAEALAELAARYFKSHGPATLHDFAWWSGLSVTEARQGLEAVKTHFISETTDKKTYWFADVNVKINVETIHLLPAFDEFMVSYRDRSASLSGDFTKNTITSNGIFKPIIVVNGRVVGVWKRTVKKDKVVIELSFFDKADIITINTLATAAEGIGQFLGMKVEVMTMK